RCDNKEAAQDKSHKHIDYLAIPDEQQRSRNGTWQRQVGSINRPLQGIGMAAVVEPSGSNMGYLGVAFTAEERARQLPKSGCTAAAAVAIDALGGITVRIDTTPEGQWHETGVQQIVAEVLDVERRR